MEAPVEALMVAPVVIRRAGILEVEIYYKGTLRPVKESKNFFLKLTFFRRFRTRLRPLRCHSVP